MRTEQPALDVFAMLEHFHYFRGRRARFEHFGEFKKEGKVQGRIHPDRLLDRSGIAPNELRIFFSLSKTSPKVKKFFFPILSAYSRIALPKVRAKSRSTYLRVSIRKPSTSNRAIAY